MAKKKASKAISETEIPNVGMVQVGKVLEHPLFGVGTVLDIAQWDTGDVTINIDFKDRGSKWLVPTSANLTEPSIEKFRGGLISRLFRRSH